MIFKNAGKERKSGLVSLLLKNWDLAPGMPWTSSKTCREAAELTPNPEHSRAFRGHRVAEALLMSSNLTFKPDLIHAALYAR